MTLLSNIIGKIIVKIEYSKTQWPRNDPIFKLYPYLHSRKLFLFQQWGRDSFPFHISLKQNKTKKKKEKKNFTVF